MLRSLGSAEDLLKTYPPDMTVQDMGEGSRSCKDFSHIQPGILVFNRTLTLAFNLTSIRSI